MHKTIFESASRATGTHTSASITTQGFVGGRFFLDVSVPNGGSIAPKVQVLDQQSGNWIDLPSAAFSATTTTTTKQLTIRPGIGETANESVSDTLGNTVRVLAPVTSAAVTFSLAVDLIR